MTKRIRDAFVGAKLMPCIGNHDSWPSDTIPIPGERDPSGEMHTSYYSELHEMAGWSNINNILDSIATESFNEGQFDFDIIIMYTVADPEHVFTGGGGVAGGGCGGSENSAQKKWYHRPLWRPPPPLDPPLL